MYLGSSSSDSDDDADAVNAFSPAINKTSDSSCSKRLSRRELSRKEVCRREAFLALETFFKACVNNVEFLFGDVVMIGNVALRRNLVDSKDRKKEDIVVRHTNTNVRKVVRFGLLNLVLEETAETAC